MLKNLSLNKIISISISFISIFVLYGIFLANIEITHAEYNLSLSPQDASNLQVINPGNLPFIHDEALADISPDSNNYGTIYNDTGYAAFAKALDFSIKTLIKLVGVMCLFGITEGLIRLIVGHGNEEIYGKGIKMIMWSVVGLILSLIAHAVVTGALQFLTGVGSLNL